MVDPWSRQVDRRSDTSLPRRPIDRDYWQSLELELELELRYFSAKRQPQYNDRGTAGTHSLCGLSSLVSHAWSVKRELVLKTISREILNLQECVSTFGTMSGRIFSFLECVLVETFVMLNKSVL